MDSAHDVPRILIVDDTYFQRLKLRNYFESRGFEVSGEADNGAKGVKMFERYKPDLVTMDINMPYMNGIEALTEIKRIDVDARVLMISAMGNPDTVRQAKDAGAFDFIVKPIATDELDEKVKSALKNSFPGFFE